MSRFRGHILRQVHFSQVVLNIISNAKYVLVERKIENAKIEIHLSKDEENIYCRIKDNAGGIEEKYIDRIFEPYFTKKNIMEQG